MLDELDYDKLLETSPDLRLALRQLAYAYQRTGNERVMQKGLELHAKLDETEGKEMM